MFLDQIKKFGKDCPDSIYASGQKCEIDTQKASMEATAKDLVHLNKIFTEKNCSEKTPRNGGSQLDAKYNDNDYMIQMRCTIQSLLQKFNQHHGAAIGTPQLNKVFSLMKPISSGAFGEVYALGFMERDGRESWPYILKTQRRANQHAAMLHELVVAYTLNSLRKFTPAFMYGFGGFWCEPVKYNDKYQACYEGSKIEDYQALAIFENCKQVTSVYDFYSVCTTKQIAELLLCVAGALTFAHHLKKFMHNDLHTGNVLLRALPQNVKTASATLIKNGEGINLVTSLPFQPTIIDFGMATCEYKDAKQTKQVLPPYVPQTEKCWMMRPPYFIPSFDFVTYFFLLTMYIHSDSISDKKKDRAVLKTLDTLVSALLGYLDAHVKFCNVTVTEMYEILRDNYANPGNEKYLQPGIYEQYFKLSSDTTNLADICEILANFEREKPLKL
jgi:hypothetical protein